MTEEDWDYLYDSAARVYRKRRFPLSLTVDDFKQVCDENALRQAKQIAEASNRMGYLYSIVKYTALEESVPPIPKTGKRNRYNSLAWLSYRCEAYVDLDQLPDESLVDVEGETVAEEAINDRIVKGKLKNILTPLEITIVDLILTGMDYKEIALILNKHRKTISRYVDSINRKLLLEF
jgi:DNA-binding CsgD family transcriptional regulator